MYENLRFCIYTGGATERASYACMMECTDKDLLKVISIKRR
jgi:succinate dehydrogenase flavin-adding protein (antitoxin of CptAB toxin-antitoxin module)